MGYFALRRKAAKDAQSNAFPGNRGIGHREFPACLSVIAFLGAFASLREGYLQ